MAGKAGKKPVQPTEATEDRTYFVRLELDGPDHKRLRVQAAKEGVPMSAFVKRVVLEALAAAE